MGGGGLLRVLVVLEIRSRLAAEVELPFLSGSGDFAVFAQGATLVNEAQLRQDLEQTIQRLSPRNLRLSEPVCPNVHT